MMTLLSLSFIPRNVYASGRDFSDLFEFLEKGLAEVENMIYPNHTQYGTTLRAMQTLLGNAIDFSATVKKEQPNETQLEDLLESWHPSGGEPDVQAYTLWTLAFYMPRFIPEKTRLTWYKLTGETKDTWVSEKESIYNLFYYYCVHVNPTMTDNLFERIDNYLKDYLSGLENARQKARGLSAWKRISDQWNTTDKNDRPKTWDLLLSFASRHGNDTAEPDANADAAAPVGRSRRHCVTNSGYTDIIKPKMEEFHEQFIRTGEYPTRRRRLGAVSPVMRNLLKLTQL